MGNTISYTTTEHTLELGSGKGAIRGVQFDQKARRYAGVPYALPPTGEHRWRKPRRLPPTYSYSSSDGIPLDATEFKLGCPQGAQLDGAKRKEGSEDCLLLNIWTPVDDKDEDGKPWPVMIWIHGGWFQIGNPSQDPEVNPVELISTGGLKAILVAVGYRLNIFGFLAGSALAKESNGEAPGNFGLWDQRAAIEWVRENISAFGGDANRITLAGLSAGAYSVEAQVLHEFRRASKTSDEAAPFHRFVMMSNAIPAQPKTVADVESQFDEVCAHFNVPAELSAEERLQRLRSISSDDLISAIPNLQNHTFRPVTDDLFFHSGMTQYLKSGEFASEFRKRGMKLLVGEVLKEDSLYAQYRGPEKGTFEELQHQVLNYYAPSTTAKVLSQYKLPESSDVAEWRDLFGKIIADGQVRAPTRCFVEYLHRNNVPVSDIWRYRIGYRLSFIPEELAPLSYGVTHSMDKFFWNFTIIHGPTPAERQLMEDWIKVLVAFVHQDETYDFGTRVIDDLKSITPEGIITVSKDESYDRLKELGEIFAGN